MLGHDQNCVHTVIPFHLETLESNESIWLIFYWVMFDINKKDARIITYLLNVTLNQKNIYLM